MTCREVAEYVEKGAVMIVCLTLYLMLGYALADFLAWFIGDQRDSEQS